MIIALKLACRRGDIESLRALLDTGTDVAQTYLDGLTALMLASSHGHAECVRALVLAGADLAQAMA
jgi:ankyrin repeat protein